MDNSVLQQTVKSFLAKWGFEAPEISSAWIEAMKVASYEKGEIITAVGQPVHELGLIQSGMVRYYYDSPDGKEWNKAFYREGDIVIAASAYLTNTPAPFTIQALEETALITVPREKLEQWGGEFPKFQHLYSTLITQAFIRNEQREAMLLTCNAEQRYQWLQEHEPSLLERVPQFHLASYIGIDAVSLSRVKRKISSQ